MRTYERPDGCRLVFETHGDPGHPTILLLEGMGGDIPGWSRTVPNLSRSLHVITYDHRGNGWSDAPDEPQTMTTFVEDALGLLDELGVARAHIYGQSFGGMVAVEFALAQPDRVRTLILAATHAGGTSVVRNRSRVQKQDADLAIFSETFSRDDPEGVAELYRIGVPQPSAGGRRQWEAMQGYDVAAQLGELTMPTLVLHGDADRVVAVQNAQVLADRIPHAELMIVGGAGHVYQWEQPKLVDAAIVEFIERHEDV